jgi:membrane-associated phospholipid phosphatase
VPSLHAAYATLFALIIFKLFKKSKWKYLSILYPALIYTGTVYQGEHYLIDELLGGVYALVGFLAAPYILKGLIRTTRYVALRLKSLARIT